MAPCRINLILFLFCTLFCSPFTVHRSLYAQDNCPSTLNKKDTKLYSDGISYLKHGNYTMAIQSMKQVLSGNPDFVDATYVMGLSWYKMANPNLKEAEKYFSRTIALCPTYDVYAYYYLGEIAYSFEQFDKTIQYLSEFLKDVEKIKKDEDYTRAVQLLEYSKFYLKAISNPVPFNPEVVEGISTPENEYLPILSPDNQTAYFTREKKMLPDRNSVIQTTRFRELFMASARNEDGSFSEGEEMPDPFNIFSNEGGATLTADNHFLYYTVCQYDKAGGYLNCDIFYSEQVNGEWTPIRNAGSQINKPNTWESQPSISTDGKMLYFVSDRPGGYGGYDLYKAMKNDDGSWGVAVNMGPVVNSKGNEKSPFIHPDGQTLYFSSDGWPGMGGYDIFFTKVREDNTIDKPQNLGYPINSPEDELGFFVSTDGTRGFFASNKFHGKGGWDLYSFELYDAARPEKVLFIKGTVKDESSAEPVKARIELRNLETKKISEIPLDTNTGKYVAVTQFRNDYVMTIKKEGYVYESKYISKVDTVFKAPAEVDVQIQPIELNKSYRINDIYFAFNSSELTEESKAVLEQMIEFLTFNGTMCIQIQGHTDNIGNDADNLKLSESRARSVYDYLIARNIAPERLSFRGFGKTDPVAPNDTEEGRAKNRRTCFVITKK
jgi:outer membrane protein OmpA-like peptidoglycan-associated protein/tetratricopeptide (TPR) repeat protein